ncbi:hypothetical protein Bbelb_139020 [Branchiostoma belcheri]|nr:hypothetical protein Bbelb_139020 [Branchiostoma belcheri]
MEEWTRLLQEGKPLDVVYLDFRKAFDTVPHVRLLRKLERYGVGGNIRNWVEDFLRLRKQRVVVNGQFSSWREVKSGIPQGSVLGPILFVIYINDLPEAVASGIKIFADDSKLYKTVHDKAGEDALQQDLNTVGEWSQAWQLLFNVTKCKVLHLGRTNLKNSYTKAANKGNQVLGLIKRTFYNLDKDTVPTLFKTMVRPHLEYGNVIWGPHYSLDQQKVEAVQRRATKLVSGLRELPYSERLKRLRLPSLGYRRRRGDMIQVFKFLTGQERVQADNFFELAGGTTRGHNFKLKVPLAKSRSRQHVFSVRVIKDWNSLPSTVVSSETVNQFKTRLDRHWEHLKYEEGV